MLSAPPASRLIMGVRPCNRWTALPLSARGRSARPAVDDARAVRIGNRAESRGAAASAGVVAAASVAGRLIGRARLQPACIDRCARQVARAALPAPRSWRASGSLPRWREATSGVGAAGGSKVRVVATLAGTNVRVGAVLAEARSRSVPRWQGASCGASPRRHVRRGCVRGAAPVALAGTRRSGGSTTAATWRVRAVASRLLTLLA